MKKGRFILSALLGIFIFGCISEYIPKGIEEVSGMLVVEGIIEEGETTITLRRTVGLLDEFSSALEIDNALVYVESNNGYRSEAGTYQGGGRYVISNIVLERENSYRIHIRNDGEEYVSAYLAPLFTPEISGITGLKREQGDPVRICVNTEDDSDQSPYYLWSYEENWEVWAQVVAYLGFEWINGQEVLVEYDPFSSNNIHYCWGRDYSKTFLLDSTEKYSSNKVVNKTLVQMEPDSDKLSVLYHIKVRQHQIRKGAYDFYYNLQKNVDSGGSIFGSMPLEVKGNVSNVNNPDEIVIGYVEVSTRVEQEQYFPVEEGLYERPNRYCPIVDERYYDYVPVYMVPEGGTFYAPRVCADCRSSSRATKNKPDFWPTDKQ